MSSLTAIFASPWVTSTLNRWRQVCITGLFGCCLAAGASAHPHVLVDMTIEPEFNHDDELIAVHQSWRFDTFYSLMLQEEIMAGGSEGKQRLVDDIVENLKGHDYYSRFFLNDEPITFDRITDQTLEEDDRAMEFHFTLHVAEPQHINGNQLSYRIYEPTYYIEMLHAEDQPLRLGERTERCQTDLEKPTPSTEKLERAVEVDEDGVDEDPTLGQHFAETMTISCQW